MITRHPTSERWAQCTEGQFSQLADSLRRQRSRRRFLAVTGSAVAGSLAGMGLWTLAVPDKSQESHGGTLLPAEGYGGILCGEVKENIELYVCNRCEPETAAKIDTHIQHCLSCKNLVVLAKTRQEHSA